MAQQTEQNRSSTAPADQSYAAYAVSRVREALAGLRYGEVRLVVQDGVVVQVDRTEKLRIERSKSAT